MMNLIWRQRRGKPIVCKGEKQGDKGDVCINTERVYSLYSD